MNEAGGDRHTARRPRRSTEMDAETVMIQFSPDVVRGFARLEAAVHDSPHFSPDILENLQEYAAGKPLSVHSALTAIAFVTREAMHHVNATGDDSAKRALDSFVGDLLGKDDRPPFAITKIRVPGR
jgi:hypothetical protein